ncbi:Lysine-specific demethylase JMJ25 [Camellia lanceoleosa]|uniref:Lysine-specific demethylase JMJ25 n=1 Tax=Camellia lanceoleosa TaxID=1840588 RepID=A0ACC0IX38_9ERIC|nr:Lysine-specific demethylase JMJ25 [Camellia lanceoleosa]
MHSANGQPVIVRDVLQQTIGLSWEPMIIALFENLDSEIGSKMSEVLRLFDCLAGCEQELAVNAHYYYWVATQRRRKTMEWEEAKWQCRELIMIDQSQSQSQSKSKSTVMIIKNQMVKPATYSSRISTDIPTSLSMNPLELLSINIWRINPESSKPCS